MAEFTRIFNFHSRSHRSHSIALRVLFFSLIWFVLVGYGGKSWVVGVPAVLFSVFLSIVLSSSSPGFSLSAKGASHFIPFFLYQSFLGGVDVMKRAFSPGLEINPGFIVHSTFLPEGAARIFFLNSISLLPGTLSADLHGNTITVHTIDKDLPVWTNIRNLEVRVAVLFQITRGQEK